MFLQDWPENRIEIEIMVVQSILLTFQHQRTYRKQIKMQMTIYDFENIAKELEELNVSQKKKKKEKVFEETKILRLNLFPLF